MLPLLTFDRLLDLRLYRIYCRIGQQAHHFAHHTELNEAGLKRKPQPATHQHEDEQIAPQRIVNRSYNIIQFHRLCKDSRNQAKNQIIE